jgi:general L-amino acid transport system permease protein
MPSASGRPEAAIEPRPVRRVRLSRAVLRERTPGYVLQAALLALVAWLLWQAVGNFLGNVRVLGVSAGFGFLRSEAGFEIAQALIAFGPGSHYADAVIVATLNTLLVVVLAGVFSTLVGVVVAFGRLAAQPLVRAISTTFVEIFRNIPLLLQIFFWYFSAMALLPGVGESIAFGGALLNNRGLFLPALQSLPAGGWALVMPKVDGFDVAGGVALLPELMALTLGLSIYNGAFLAEIFRAGIRSVSRGQTEAAATLGLAGVRAAWFVTLPQALRLALPPATGQYQTLAKASSLAAAIGYPDIMQIVGGTVLSQTSQALEAMALVVLLYASINLAIAAAGQLANRRLLRREAR